MKLFAALAGALTLLVLFVEIANKAIEPTLSKAIPESGRVFLDFSEKGPHPVDARYSGTFPFPTARKATFYPLV